MEHSVLWSEQSYWSYSLRVYHRWEPVFFLWVFRSHDGPEMLILAICDDVTTGSISLSYLCLVVWSNDHMPPRCSIVLFSNTPVCCVQYQNEPNVITVPDDALQEDILKHSLIRVRKGAVETLTEKAKYR